MFAGWLWQGLQWICCWSFFHPTSWKSFAILGKKSFIKQPLEIHPHKEKKRQGNTNRLPKRCFFFLATSNWCCHFPKQKSTVSPHQPLPKSFGKILPHQSTTSGAWSNTTKAYTSPSSGATLDNSLIFRWGWNFTSVENVERSGKNMPLFPEATCICILIACDDHFNKYLWFPSCWARVPSFSTCIIWKKWPFGGCAHYQSILPLTTWKDSKSRNQCSMLSSKTPSECQVNHR